MDLFAEVVNSSQPLTTFAKSSTLYVRQGFVYKAKLNSSRFLSNSSQNIKLNLFAGNEKADTFGFPNYFDDQ